MTALAPSATVPDSATVLSTPLEARENRAAIDRILAGSDSAVRNEDLRYDYSANLALASDSRGFTLTVREVSLHSRGIRDTVSLSVFFDDKGYVLKTSAGHLEQHQTIEGDWLDWANELIAIDQSLAAERLTQMQNMPANSHPSDTVFDDFRINVPV